jgi:hypothetical protein
MEYAILTFSWQDDNHEPILTTDIMQDLRKTQAEKLHQELLKLVASRNHELVSGHYENKDSIIVVRCLTHGSEHQTKTTNYKRSITGMPCCGKEKQSKATAYHNTLRPARSKLLKSSSTLLLPTSYPLVGKDTDNKSLNLIEFD